MAESNAQKDANKKHKADHDWITFGLPRRIDKDERSLKWRFAAACRDEGTTMTALLRRWVIAWTDGERTPSG